MTGNKGPWDNQDDPRPLTPEEEAQLAEDLETIKKYLRPARPRINILQVIHGIACNLAFMFVMWTYAVPVVLLQSIWLQIPLFIALGGFAAYGLFSIGVILWVFLRK